MTNDLIVVIVTVVLLIFPSISSIVGPFDYKCWSCVNCQFLNWNEKHSFESISHVRHTSWDWELEFIILFHILWSRSLFITFIFLGGNSMTCALSELNESFRARWSDRGHNVSFGDGRYNTFWIFNNWGGFISSHSNEIQSELQLIKISLTLQWN